MAWAKLDDEFYDHPKVLRVSLAATGLYALCLSYAARKMTDGALPANAVRRLAGDEMWEALAEQLVHVGLWEREHDGFRIHDFLAYNRSKAEVLADRAALRAVRSQAGRAGAAARWQRDSTSNGKPMANGWQEPSQGPWQTDGPIPVPIPVPIPNTETANTLSLRSCAADGASVLGFDEFWLAYPKKLGKGAARKAHRKLRPSAGMQQQILDAIAAWRSTEAWTRDGGRWVPYPAKWLNERRWEDERETTTTRADEVMRLADERRAWREGRQS